MLITLSQNKKIMLTSKKIENLNLK